MDADQIEFIGDSLRSPDSGASLHVYNEIKESWTLGLLFAYFANQIIFSLRLNRL